MVNKTRMSIKDTTCQSNLISTGFKVKKAEARRTSAVPHCCVDSVYSLERSGLALRTHSSGPQGGMGDRGAEVARGTHPS